MPGKNDGRVEQCNLRSGGNSEKAFEDIRSIPGERKSASSKTWWKTNWPLKRLWKGFRDKGALGCRHLSRSNNPAQDFERRGLLDKDQVLGTSAASLKTSDIIPFFICINWFHFDSLMTRYCACLDLIRSRASQGTY